MKQLMKEYTVYLLLVIIATILGIKFIVEDHILSGCLWIGIAILYVGTIVRSRIKKLNKN